MLKVSFICNDSDLINKFKAFDEFQIVNTFGTIDEAVSSQADLIIISDSFVGINELITRTELKEKYSKVYYIVSPENLDYNTDNILSNYGICMIPPLHTAQQIFDLICSKELNLIYDNNIVVFFGCDSKVGTTMLSQTVAEVISNHAKDKKVFLGFLNGVPGVDYIKGKTPGNLDQIKPKLLDKVLIINDIIAECKQIDNLFILEGVNNYLYRTDYDIEDVELLLKIVSGYFDIVIIDAGSNIELALCLGSLLSTKNRYLVTTPQMKPYSNFKIIYPILEKLGVNRFSLIINMYMPEFGKPFEIADRYNNFNLACIVPFLENGWQAEHENSILYTYKDKNYCSSVETLSEIIAKSVGLELSITQKKRNFKLFVNWGVLNGRG